MKIGLKTIKHCGQCPGHTAKRTPNSGYALDYFCSFMNGKKITGYVEWDSELEKIGIPNFCPLMPKKDKEKQKEEEKYKYMDGL